MTSFIFLAPDQNPTGVQGFGTEHDNLVISWKVIKMYLYNLIWLNPEVVSFIQGERALMSFTVMNLTCVLNFLLSQPLSGLQANGPGLHYKVMWRQKDLDSEWTSVTVANNSKFVVSGTPTFVPYELKVQAVNDYGAGPEPAVAQGFSGEDRKF